MVSAASESSAERIEITTGGLESDSGCGSGGQQLETVHHSRC